MLFKRLAAIDVGSNTVRLLLAGQNKTGQLCPLRRERIITRLGGKYTQDKGLEEKAMERTIEALKTFQNLLGKGKDLHLIAVGTGVMRDAPNREEFRNKVYRETGIELRILTGEEEAKFMLKGILWGWKEEKEKECLFVDIGGWSTEIVWVQNNLPIYTQSVDLGAVALGEKFLSSDPPAKREEILLNKYIKDILRSVRAEFINHGLAPNASLSALIGTAGTITTLAAIDQKLTNYDPQKINKHSLRLEKIKKIYEDLVSLPPQERLKIPGLEKGREDLIIAGMAILINLMEIFYLPRLIVIDSGLLEGILLTEFLS
ncbi:MAG: Ppx/GppA phosphatase family protein [Thermodesulfobacteriota bacterium]